jgi:hypothetical protein
MTDGTFSPGNTFGVKGKPKGVRYRATKIYDALAAKNTKAIASLLFEKAAAGEPWAIQLIAKPMLPKRLDLVDEPVETPAPATAAEAARALAAIYSGVASGTIDLEAAQAMTAPLQALISATSVAALEAQVAEARETIERLKAEVETLRKPAI